MQVPQYTLVASVTPMGGVDTALHELVGLSWHVLLPYTLFGGVLMTYSQVRLIRGERALKAVTRRKHKTGRQTTGVSYRRLQQAFTLW